MSNFDNLGHRPALAGMNVSLTQELAEYVRRKVESGLYTSASEVVREGLRLLAEQDNLSQLHEEEFRRQIAEGLRSAEETPHVDGNDVFDQLEARLRKLEEKRKRS
jgi:antitoxin ParD1/3/4